MIFWSQTARKYPSMRISTKIYFVWVSHFCRELGHILGIKTQLSIMSIVLNSNGLKLLGSILNTYFQYHGVNKTNKKAAKMPEMQCQFRR